MKRRRNDFPLCIILCCEHGIASHVSAKNTRRRVNEPNGTQLMRHPRFAINADPVEGYRNANKEKTAQK